MSLEQPLLADDAHQQEGGSAYAKGTGSDASSPSSSPDEDSLQKSPSINVESEEHPVSYDLDDDFQILRPHKPEHDRSCCVTCWELFRGMCIVLIVVLGARWPYSFVLQQVARAFMIDRTYLDKTHNACKIMALAGCGMIALDVFISFVSIVVVVRKHLRHPLRLAIAYEVFRSHLVYRIYILLVAFVITAWFAVIAFVSVSGWPDSRSLKVQFADHCRERIADYPGSKVCQFAPSDVTTPVFDDFSFVVPPPENNTGGGGGGGGGGFKPTNYWQLLLSTGMNLFKLGEGIYELATFLSALLPFFTRPIPLLFTFVTVGLVPALTYRTPMTDVHVRYSKYIPKVPGVGLLQFIWENPSGIVARVCDALLLVNSDSDVTRMSKNSSLTHYGWFFLEGLSTPDLVSLKNFIFSAGMEEPSGWYDRGAIFCVPLCRLCCKPKTYEDIDIDEPVKNGCCYDCTACCSESPIRSGFASCLYVTYLLLLPFLSIATVAASSVTLAYEWLPLIPMLITYILIGPCISCCLLSCVTRCCTCVRNELEAIVVMSLMMKSRLVKFVTAGLLVLFFFQWYNWKSAWAVQFSQNCNSNRLFNFSMPVEQVNLLTPLFQTNLLFSDMKVSKLYNLSGLYQCDDGVKLSHELHEEYCLGYSTTLLGNPLTFLLNNLVCFPFVLVAFVVIVYQIMNRRNNASRAQLRRLFEMHREGIRLPSLNIPPLTLLATRDPGILLRNALVVLQLVPTAKEIRRLKTIPMYRYFYLNYVSDLTDDQLLMLRKFFFPWQFGEEDRSSCCDWLYENDPPCLWICCTAMKCAQGVYCNRNKEKDE